jgi:hypothetical protein
MSDSEHTAVGQALGYVYQFERATYRLLESDSAVVSVGLEHIDDVSVHRVDSTIREQDKATTVDDGRPLTDRSVALWKTLAIWADAVLADPAILASTEFHLVTNGEVALDSLAARIHAAETAAEADSVASELLTMAPGLRQDLLPFSEKVRVLAHLLSTFVRKVFVLDRVSATFGGDLEHLPSLRLLGSVQRTAVFDNAAGWVRRTVLEQTRQGKPTLLDRAAFDREIKALFRRVAVAPLAAVFEPDDSAIDPGNYRSHGFFQQLDWIDTDASFVRDCVIHYVQARVARVKWTDADAVSETSLRAYEEDLKTRWKLHVRRQAQRTYPSATAQGQERLTDTLSEDSILDGQIMPKAITCGNFHALANFEVATEPEIGWHPDFERLAKDTRGKS